MIIPCEIELTEKDVVKTNMVFSMVFPAMFDVSGNAHAVTNTGSVGDGSDLGSLMSSYFDGVDDLVTVADSSALDVTGAITLEALIKYETGHGTTTPSILSKVFNAQTYAGLCYGLGLNTSTGAINVYLDGATYSRAVSFTVGKVHHIVGTHDGSGGVNFYLDGAKQTALSGAALTRTSADDLTIGVNKHDASTQSWYKGNILAVRIYSAELTHTQVNQNFISYKDMAGYYKS